MPRYIALLRGINVGGHHKLPMKGFRALLETLDCKNVATYIQSGNAVFDYARTATGLGEKIVDSIEAGFGFRPTVLVLRGDEFRSIADANPYKDEAVEAKCVHIGFLVSPASAPDHDRLQSLAADTERYTLGTKAFYLCAPDGIGRSKLAGSIDSCLGVETTGRNLRTVTKLLEMLV